MDDDRYWLARVQRRERKNTKIHDRLIDKMLIRLKCGKRREKREIKIRTEDHKKFECKQKRWTTGQREYFRYCGPFDNRQTERRGQPTIIQGRKVIGRQKWLKTSILVDLPVKREGKAGDQQLWTQSETIGAKEEQNTEQQTHTQKGNTRCERQKTTSAPPRGTGSGVDRKSRGTVSSTADRNLKW